MKLEFGLFPLYILIKMNLGSFKIKCNSDIFSFLVRIFTSISLLCEQFHMISLSNSLLDKIPYLVCREPGNVQNTIANTQ